MFDEHDIQVPLDIVSEEIQINIGFDSHLQSTSPAYLSVHWDHLGGNSAKMKL